MVDPHTRLPWDRIWRLALRWLALQALGVAPLGALVLSQRDGPAPVTWAARGLLLVAAACGVVVLGCVAYVVVRAAPALGEAAVAAAKALQARIERSVG